MIGLDTGFFVELMKGNEVASQVWKEILDGQDATVSRITCVNSDDLD